MAGPAYPEQLTELLDHETRSAYTTADDDLFTIKSTTAFSRTGFSPS